MEKAGATAMLAGIIVMMIWAMVNNVPVNESMTSVLGTIAGALIYVIFKKKES